MKNVFLFVLLFTTASGCAASLRGPEQTDSGVRFTLSAPEALSVSLAGSFNHWHAGPDLLRGPDKNGLWTITLPLPAGRYEYRFIVNGRDWILDPAAPSMDDGMGGRNSVVVVSP